MDDWLVRRPDGRYYDERLGPACDELYRFASEHSLRLGVRYYLGASWSLSWESESLRRTVEIIIAGEGPPRVHFVPHASIDDDKAGVRRYMTTPRRKYTVWLPADTDLFLDTLNLAYRDANTLRKEHLDAVGAINRQED